MGVGVGIGIILAVVLIVVLGVRPTTITVGPVEFEIPTIPPKSTQAISVTSFEVFADRSWQDTGIVISTGDTVQISYISGSWTVWKGVDPSTDGNGQEGRRDPCTAVPDHNTSGLVGQIGNDAPFWIGNDVTLRQPRLSGNLKLGINDCPPLGGNDGSLTVHIAVARP